MVNSVVFLGIVSRETSLEHCCMVKKVAGIYKQCSLAMVAPQPIENQQRLYEVCEKKYDMECTTVQSDLLNICEQPALLARPLLTAMVPTAFLETSRQPERFPQGTTGFLEWQTQGHAQ